MAKTSLRPKNVRDQDDLDTLSTEEKGREISSVLIQDFLRMLPREIFDATDSGRKSIARANKYLEENGVYILYRDDLPYYIGQAKTQTLFQRLRQHATNPDSRRYLFWNYFSVFVISPEHIDEVEAILISAMPSVLANGAVPRFKNRVKMDHSTRALVRKMRRTHLPV